MSFVTSEFKVNNMVLLQPSMTKFGYSYNHLIICKDTILSIEFQTV